MSGIPGQREAPGDIDPATLSVDSPASSLTQDPYVKESPVSQADADSGVPPLHAYNVGTATQTPNSSASPAQLSFSAGSDTKSREQTVPSACLGCRSKHLKCDGQNPCSRCVASDLECIYVASRRGYKGPRRGTSQNPNKRQATSPPSIDSGATTCPMLLGANGSAGQNVANNQLYRPFVDATDFANPSTALTQFHPTAPAHVPLKSLEERCLDAYFFYFHASHPFVLPRDTLLRKASDGTIEPLLAAMRWVGSLYVDAGSSRSSMLSEALRRVYQPQQPKDGFLLQAMMIVMIGQDGCGQDERAREMLAEVERMALQIGLNTRSFATLHGHGMPVMEESWRRTWWDLYVTDAMIAGVHRMTNFLLYDMPADVALPCEERQYLSSQIPQPMYLEDLEDREFSGDDREFSSFAYRILCARNLGKFMRLPPIFGPDDENVARMEALITNWRLHLPETKKHALDEAGELDEMMFQANMMSHATSILLHQPHSQLDSAPAQAINSCAPPPRIIPSSDLYNAHTKHTISSAVEISKLITHRVPLLSHTHFFTCVITLSSIVHLSKWALSFVPHDDDDLRQQIRLNIGALNRMSDVWAAADKARGQVKGVAQEIYKAKRELQMNPQYWLGYSQEDMLNSLASDDTMLSEIEGLEDIPNMSSLIE